MKFWNGYLYLYYRIYTYQLGKWGREDGPEYSALIGVSLLLWVNMLTVPLLFEIVAGRGLSFAADLPNSVWNIFVLSTLVINYFIFVHQRKYQWIVKKFAHETSVQKRKRGIYVWVYILGTVTLALGSGYAVLIKNSQ